MNLEEEWILIEDMKWREETNLTEDMILTGDFLSGGCSSHVRVNGSPAMNSF